MEEKLKYRMILCIALLFACTISTALANNVMQVNDVADLDAMYRKENREYAAIPSIEVTGSRVWAAWMSGGDTEPHEDNYIVMAYSDDNCQTWVEPYMIVDAAAEKSRTCNPLYWVDPAGRLWFFWVNSGTWAMYTENPCDAPEEIVWSQPKKISKSTALNKPIVIVKDGVETWLLCVQDMSALPTTSKYLVSTDGGLRWKVNRGYAKTESANKWYLEAMIVEKLDGTLWMFSRTEKGYNGGIEQSFSYDQGDTWTTFEGSLSYPLQGPGSRFQIYRLQSGNLAWVSHDTTSSRSRMSIWLSEDDGATWPYQLMLDDSSNVTYPDIAQGEDGSIYVIWDKGRSTDQEIRLACFTEDDIRAGSYMTENAKEKAIVTKTSQYKKTATGMDTIATGNADYIETLTSYAHLMPVKDIVALDAMYQKGNRTFAAIPTVEVTGNRVWAAWMSGGDTEPHEDNYIIMAFSDDGGLTWQEPYMIVDPVPKSRRSCNPLYWLDPHGRLWFFWVDSSTWAMYTDNPCDTPENIIWSEPRRISSNVALNKPTVIEKDGVETWLLCVQNMSSFTSSLFITSTDRGATWTINPGFAESRSENKWYLEGVIVEKRNGALWMLTRTEKGYEGGVEQAFSYDQGETWTKFVGNLPYPLQGPGSRFQMIRLKSGNLMWVSHDTTRNRSKMSVWLSEDDGATWPYQLMLDERSGVSYPDIAQGEDGAIYVIWDKGRSVEQEIRLARFTEEDVKAGAYVSEQAQSLIVVTKTGGYEDIVSVEEELLPISADTQAACEAMLSELPKMLHVRTDAGKRYELTGEWVIQEASETSALVVFQTELPERVVDVLNLLRVSACWTE